MPLNAFIRAMIIVHITLIAKAPRLNHVQGTELTLRSSTTVSANPTTYMATATALAKAKMSPMEPPNSGPKLLEIR